MMGAGHEPKSFHSQQIKADLYEYGTSVLIELENVSLVTVKGKEKAALIPRNISRNGH